MIDLSESLHVRKCNPAVTFYYILQGPTRGSEEEEGIEFNLSLDTTAWDLKVHAANIIKSEGKPASLDPGGGSAGHIYLCIHRKIKLK